MAVDDNLWAESWSWERVLLENVDTIGNRAGGSMSPAATTVLWNVLVTSPGEVVDTVDVTPEPVIWESCGIDSLIWLWGHDLLAVLPPVLWHTTSLAGVWGLSDIDDIVIGTELLLLLGLWSLDDGGLGVDLSC
jgi:hypothetical protein